MPSPEVKNAEQIFVDAPDIAAGRFSELIALGEELTHAQMDVRMDEIYENKPVLEKLARVRELKRTLQSRLAPVRAAFESEATIPEGLKAVYELLAVSGVSEQIGKIVIDSLDPIVAHIEKFPAEMPVAIQVITDTEMNLGEDNLTHGKASRGARKIRAAIRTLTPALEVFFSEANTPTDNDLNWQFLALRRLGGLVPRTDRERDWVLNALIRYLVMILKSSIYVPEISAASVDKMIEDHSFKLPETTRYSITKQDVQSLFMQLGNPKLIEHVYEAVHDALGVPVSLYKQKTEDGEMKLQNPKHVFEQAEMAAALERQRPGSVEALKKVGIRWFSRYPLEILIKRYDELNMDKPYGVLMTSVRDVNAAFFDNEHEFISKFSRDLEQAGYALRIIECDGIDEMTRLLGEAHAQYGEKNRISFLLMRAHGGQWSADLSADYDQDLYSTSFEKPAFMEKMNVFVPNPTWIFDGCSQGLRNGLAQKASKGLNGTVFGPQGLQAALDRVEVATENDRLRLTPVYGTIVGSRAKYENGGHRYVNGRKRNLDDNESGEEA